MNPFNAGGSSPLNIDLTGVPAGIAVRVPLGSFLIPEAAVAGAVTTDAHYQPVFAISVVGRGVRGNPCAGDVTIIVGEGITRYSIWLVGMRRGADTVPPDVFFQTRVGVIGNASVHRDGVIDGGNAGTTSWSMNGLVIGAVAPLCQQLEFWACVEQGETPVSLTLQVMLDDASPSDLAYGGSDLSTITPL